MAAAFARLGDESRYRRFFTGVKELSAAELDHLADVDHSDHEAIIAVDPASGDVLGVARYVRSTDDPEAAELAVTVIDDWQGRGLGRALLTALTRCARREAYAASARWFWARTRRRSRSSTASATPAAGMPPAPSSS